MIDPILIYIFPLSSRFLHLVCRDFDLLSTQEVRGHKIDYHKKTSGDTDLVIIIDR